MSSMDITRSNKQTYFETDKNIHQKMTSSTNDVFEGRVLIDRLLVYYSKFEGSREKAAHYAQKLLDLGHIESLTNSVTFQDSVHVYRWANASRTMNEVRRKGADQQKKDDERKVIFHPYPRNCRPEIGEDSGKSVLRISIETDNCQNAEIKANIKAAPRYDKTEAKNSVIEPKSITTIEEDSFFGRRITKTLSYLTDNKNRIETQQKKLYIADVPSSTKAIDVSSNNCDARKQEYDVKSRKLETMKEISHQDNAEVMAESNSAMLSPRKKPFWGSSRAIETKQLSTRVEKGQRLSAVSCNSEADWIAAEQLAPGPDVQSDERRDGERSTDDIINYLNLSESVKSNKKITKVFSNGLEKVVNGHDHPPTLIASTQTSEKSILEASKLYKPNGSSNEKRSPSPVLESSKSRIINSENEDEEGKQRKIKERELERVNREKQQKKAYFNDEVSQASFISEEGYGAIYHKSFNLMNDHQMLLHSNGNAEDIFQDQRNGFERNQQRLSSPPPSPEVKIQAPVSSPMKSLFWTKLSKNGLSQNYQNVFWDELTIEDIFLDESEFEKLFRKPPESPQTPRVAGHLMNNGRVLKVLGMERSRQVGIRVSLVRVPVEEIHDAIINMDDEKLSLDALQALCDIKPTSEELDQIADALEAGSDAVLDKPEQFILMLAMIPSLEERLKCWIYAKKFPDKIVEIQDQLSSLNDACNQIMQSVTFKKTLQLVLLFGNRMNKGSQRGEAYGFHFDILPKLKDVKSQKGDINLLQYLIKVMRQQMKLEGTLDEQISSPRESAACGLPDTELLQRATSVSLAELGENLEKQAEELRVCKEKLLPIVLKQSTISAESDLFESKMQEFFEKAIEKLRIQARFYSDVLLTVEDFLLYFIPDSETKSKETFFFMLRSIAEFCQHFRRHWSEAQKEVIKEEFYKIQKYRKNRQAEIHVKNTPSALKERFLSRRKHDYFGDTTLNKKLSNGVNGNNSYPLAGASTSFTPKKIYKFEEPIQREKITTPKRRNNSREQSNWEMEGFSDRSVENSFRIEKRMQELQSLRHPIKS